ncbi:unnamed protein product [Mucor hiemalis]
MTSRCQGSLFCIAIFPDILLYFFSSFSFFFKLHYTIRSNKVMGLKKLFSSSSHHKAKEDGLKNYENNNKRHSSRSSTLSLAHSIKSSFTTHNKDKHQSLNTSTTNNRYSQPSPPSSISQQPRHSLNVTQNERHHYNNNPFLPTPEITPVTPSDSMRDVNNVVNVLRNSVSSEMLSSKFSVEEEHDFTIPVIAVMNEIKEEPYDVAVLDKPLNAEPMEIYPPNEQESNKFQVFDDEIEEEKEEEGKHTMLTPNATNKEVEDALYNELLQVSSQLEKIDPKNAVEIKDKLAIINHTLTTATDKSHQLHTKLVSIIDISKQIVLATTEKNKELMETQERLNLELQQLQEGHTLALNNNNTLYKSLCDENDALKEKYQHTQHELNEHVQTRKDIFNLIKMEKEEEMNDTLLVNKLKTLTALLTTHKALQEELKSKESALDDIQSKYQQLIMKSENDEISERRNEAEVVAANKIKELEEQLHQEIDARLSLEEKIKLEESSTSQTRAELLSQIDNLKSETAQQLQVREAEMTDLRDTLESTKSENTQFLAKIKELEANEEQLQTANDNAQQLKEKINAFKIENAKLKEELSDMETMSKDAARTVIDENEKLEQRIQDSDNQIITLSNQVQSLTEDKAEIADGNQELKCKLESLEHENAHLSKLVESLKSQVERFELKRQPSKNNKKREQDQQEELMRMHTKAQLSLIEYLEGEDNIMAAMATLKKGLEERA